MKRHGISIILSCILFFVGVEIGNASISTTCGTASVVPCIASSVQGSYNGKLFNSQTTGAVNTAVTVTITAINQATVHVFSIDAFCSAGTSTVTITDGATQIWSTVTGEIGTARVRVFWPVALTATRGNAMTITLATCGIGNTGTLAVQASQY